MIKPVTYIILVSVLSLLGCKKTDFNKKQPNILLILADDLGYSDLGCFGSEIPTPNLDELAYNGVRMTQFYNSAKCCPSRASLLTGLYPHQAGMGDMVEGRMKADGTFLPAYQGFLSDSSYTISEMLSANNYYTMMVGKWHLGDEKPHWPHNRKFDKIYTLIPGMSNYFNLDPWRKPGQEILLLEGNDTVVPGKEFYMTTSFTQKAVEYLKKRPDKKPFFMYLAYTAPHFPLQAPAEDIDLFRGKYMSGWDSIRFAKFEAMKSLGIISETTEISPAIQKGDLTPEWNRLKKGEKVKFDLRMATHAAMIYRMDQGIGQVVSVLKEQNVLDNTLIIFLSDNGASEAAFYLVNDIIADRSGEIGTAKSFDSQGPSWGNVSNTPLSLFKKYTGEGGIRTCFIAHWPDRFEKGQILHSPGHMMDILPTLLDISGSTYPADKTPIEGTSLLPLWQNRTVENNRNFGFEHMGHKAFRQGPWKAVYINKESLNHTKEWELYHIDNDPGEVQDLSEVYPEKLDSLIIMYQAWAERVGVYEPYDSLILRKAF